MENASKALLIAGGILLIVALISIAYALLGNSEKTINSMDGNIDSMEIQMHNSEFEAYDGLDKTVEEAKQLLSLVFNNNKELEEGDNFFITLTFGLQGSSSNPNSYSYVAVYDWNNIKTTYGDIEKWYTHWFFNNMALSVGESKKNNGNTYNIKVKYNSKGIVNDILFVRHFE